MTYSYVRHDSFAYTRAAAIQGGPPSRVANVPIHVCVTSHLYTHGQPEYWVTYIWSRYGVATISRIVKIIGLICTISSVL